MKEHVIQTIESSLSVLAPQSKIKMEDSKWKINLDNVEIQIAIDEISPELSLSIYFVVLQLPQNNRAACIEELMNANFHIRSKYALFNGFILQLVDIPQANSISSGHLAEMLGMYTNHVNLLRNDLYVKYYN